MSVQLIVLDLAGTTVQDNQDVQRVLIETLSRVGIPITMEEAAAVMGIPKPVAIEQLLRERDLFSADFVSSIHDDFVFRMIDFYRKSPDVVEKAGVSDTFRYFKSRGVKIVVDTGFDRPITNALLQRMGWAEAGLIDGSITSDEVPLGRPHPDMIWEAMRLTGVTKTDFVAKVGDTASDLGEGNSAGCRWVIGITSGAFTREQLEALPHTHLIDQIPDLKAILGE